jgi:outer membrane protein assembly factor BamB
VDEVRRPTLAAAIVVAMVVLPCGAQAEWPTYHGDAARTGVDQSSGAALPFASAWSTPDLGADMWAEPLVYRGLVIVATENNDLIALNESNGQVVWRANAGPAVPSSKLPCGDISPTVGITGTPVIDATTGDLYAVADMWDGSNAQHTLVAYNATTGAELFRRPVDPAGSTHLDQLQRPGLALDGGRVLIGYGGNDGDCGTYWGFVVSAPADNAGGLSQWQTPTTKGGAIWAGGGAPAIDSAGAVFVATGNAASSSSSNFDHGDTLEKLDSVGDELDYFAPSSWASDNAGDADLGSVAPQLLSGGLAYQGGKNGNGYLVNSQNLGHQIGGELYSAPVCDSYGADAFVGSTIYVACTSGVRALSLDVAGRRFSASWKGPSDANGPPILAGGLVWVTSTVNAKLYGLDAATGATRITQATPAMQHFITPAASDGKLFLATDHTAEAYTIAVAVSPPAGATGGGPSGGPSGGSGAGSPVAPPGPTPTAPKPRAPACPAQLRFHLVVPRHSAIVRVRVYRGRTRLLNLRGRHLSRAAITAPAPSLTLRVVETTRAGGQIRFTVVFRACRRVALTGRRRRRR